MVGHAHRAVVASFWTPERVATGETVTLGPDAAHHMRVRRLAVGGRVGLSDGAGQLAAGTLISLERSRACVHVDETTLVARPRAVHLLVPVADRDRLLWLAEKCSELQATSWRPVEWRRSASVASRGAGAAFALRLKGRMIAALTQSGGAWLPELHDPASLTEALDQTPPGLRILLDPAGAALLRPAERAGVATADAVTIAVGPEGGIEGGERAQLEAAGFVSASLGDTILRFETAAIAALSIVRARLWASTLGGAGGSAPVESDGGRRGE